MSLKTAVPLPVRRAVRRIVGERPTLVPATSSPTSPGPLDCFIAYNEYGGYAVPRSSVRRPSAQRIMQGRVWEPETLAVMREHCGTGDIVHAGVYFGDFLPFLSRICQATVHAFEPNPENFRCSEITLILNGLENVTLIEAGLGAESRTASLRTLDGSGTPLGGGSRVTDDGDTNIDITTIDAHCHDRDVSIIQLDVEGQEGPALLGAQQTIARCHPVIVYEVQPGLTAAFISEHLPGYAEVARINMNVVLSWSE